jgi:hypothetical protein
LERGAQFAADAWFSLRVSFEFKPLRAVSDMMSCRKKKKKEKKKREREKNIKPHAGRN